MNERPLTQEEDDAANRQMARFFFRLHATKAAQRVPGLEDAFAEKMVRELRQQRIEATDG